MCVPLNTQISRLVGKLGSREQVTSSWMAVITQTDRNLCVIEVFGDVFVLSLEFCIFLIL